MNLFDKNWPFFNLISLGRAVDSSIIFTCSLQIVIYIEEKKTVIDTNSTVVLLKKETKNKRSNH
ncbi:hypothetical protein BpHYR1_030452 [Brachionus plicatilis]|uniref:Uncharacterized protein n=1 Tax=Brachionus plicatilis TaxID=10195 RepID=A0A3M7QUD7_BRAPC|nr:hypothetical protein BpHYR1_030452 [Brachionus plicatilis]